MARKRILITHPRLTASGGGNAVAAWTLQALRDGHELELATLQEVDFAAVNRSWGTSLREHDVRIHVAPPLHRHGVDWFPTPAALLQTCVTMRLAQELDRRNRYDVLLSTHNEADFGKRGIQYIHHPWVYMPRPREEMRWYHYIPGSLPAYRGFCRHVARGTNEGLRRNLTIANSSFIAGRVRRTHGIESVIVFPPVTGNFPPTAWEDRVPSLVGVGRISGSKRWNMAVAIVDEVRRRGHDVGLTLVSHRDDAAVLRRLQRLAATRPWFRLRLDLSRSELEGELARHRFGIHTMENEHFGMGPAEILRAGCLLFAHDSGGPVEILGGERRLLFADVIGAADAIERVLRSPALQEQLRQRMEERRRLFSVDAFCSAMQEIVSNFAP